MSVKMPLPSKVSFIIDRIKSFGHRADIVGGCTRDFLLGIIPSDYDITTDATPDEMKEIFSGMRTVDTGIRHGTVTLILDGEPYEITTYRFDGEYKDHRHPEKVSFTRLLSEDLKRRDFTMNAICYNETNGFTDLFGGLSDIKKKIIRAVGDPDVRFEEDALRIMRAIRFSAVLGFAIESKTAEAALKKRGLLDSVSKERIAVEWKKLLGGDSAYSVIEEYSEIIAAVIPELSGARLPDKERFCAESDAHIRELSLFYSAVGTKSPELYEAVATRLRYDTKSKKFGVTVLAYADYSDTGSDIGLKKLLCEIGYESALGVLRLRRVLFGNTDAAIIRLSELQSDAVYKLSQLAVDGRDLEAEGFTGKEIGLMLKQLLLGVVEEKYQNTKEELLYAIRSLRR